VLAKERLAAALLTRSEMNAGNDYEQNVPDPGVLGGTETAVRPDCQPFVDLALPGNGRPAPIAVIKATTTSGAGPSDPMPAGLDVIELYAFGPGQAEALLTKGRQALATCSSITTKDKRGEATTMVYTRAQAPALGGDEGRPARRRPRTQADDQAGGGRPNPTAPAGPKPDAPRVPPDPRDRARSRTGSARACQDHHMDWDRDAPPVDRELLDFAVRLIARAGRLSARGFFGEWHGRRKSDGTEVTDVDLAVEELIRGELARRAPDDGIHGEEGGTSVGSSGRRWVIDPINGTSLFTRRAPLFTNDLAYEDEYGPAVGVINWPMSRQLVVAGRGRGCWLLLGDEPDLADGRRVRVGERSRLGGARTGAHNPAGWPEELLTALHRRVFLTPGFGGVADLVTGRIDAMVVAGPAMGYEDVATLPVIVVEAGGRVTDLGGHSVLTGDMTILATNGRLHEGFLDLLAGLPRRRDVRDLDAAG
jgi:histidinol-phosphatase